MQEWYLGRGESVTFRAVSSVQESVIREVPLNNVILSPTFI